jgi:(S)-ureidoglycine aminohydrolase
MRKATAIVHIAPAGGAKFTQYTAELEPDGRLGPAVGQRFVYVLDGTLMVEGRRLEPGGFAYLPAGHSGVVSAMRFACGDREALPALAVPAPSFTERTPRCPTLQERSVAECVGSCQRSISA